MPVSANGRMEAEMKIDIVKKIAKKAVDYVRFFLENTTPWSLLGKCILMLAIPYVYLIVCGLIFDKLLKWYFMTTFIFVSLMVFYFAAFVMIAVAIYRFMKGRRSDRKQIHK